MKKTLISMAILMVATVAQAQVTVPEPEYVGQVVFLTSDTTARFIIRAKDNDLDPTGCVGIFKYVVNKKKNRESSYLVEATFEPGEYAVDIQGSGNAMSTFRIIKPEEGKE